MIDWKMCLRWSSLSRLPAVGLLKVVEAVHEHRHPLFRWGRWILVSTLIMVPIIYELRTSALQSWVLSRFARSMSYRLEAGPSPSVVFPKHGPFDVRAGYTLIPDFERRLHAAGYKTTDQVRFSPELERAVKWGILPPYPEPRTTKLTISGMDGHPLFQAQVESSYFGSFEEIPPLVVKSLLLIENRELGDPVDYRTNPVVDWNRLAKAAIFYAGSKLGLPLQVEGGSTLATQIEKYRHSSDGRTNSILAKLRQMTDASLKVYQKGTDTRAQRRRIVLDYLNSIPLAAAPRHGEIHGIANGLKSWFGLDLQDVQHALALPDDRPEKAIAFKHMLALLCSVKGPTYYLVSNRGALSARANFYARLLDELQVITPEFANTVVETPITFSTRPPRYATPSYAERKAINGTRAKLSSLLGIRGMYDLDRLHLDVESTIDPALQRSVVDLFTKLRDPDFVESHGLRGKRLLQKGDPSKVVYGMMLFEKRPHGNLLRVVTDTLNAPFDINTGMKMQLGSTAKLRTLVNYLDIVASLYAQFSMMDVEKLSLHAQVGRDPISRWAAETLATAEKKPSLEEFLQLALDRKYSAGPGEAFFTGGGLHYFNNFDKKDNGRIVTVREATAYSINLPYVRLMRDLVRYYEARLPYNTAEVLLDMNNATRRKLLTEIGDEESRHFLFQAYKAFQKRSETEVVDQLLGKNKSERQLAILFYAWHRIRTEGALTQWLKKHWGEVKPEDIAKLMKAYRNPQLNLSDYGYLLGIHPLRVWCAGELIRNPSRKWDVLWDDSAEARQIAGSWLFKTRNRAAQDLRLRIRFEQDAFTRMTPHWKRLGFPFDRLVPSYATALGSSGDRPEALSQLMGVLLNDGVMKPSIRMARLRFAAGTPYETVLAPAPAKKKQVIAPAIARAILPVLAQVVQSGTAVRLAGAIKNGDKPIVIGGKTGSGDNRFDTFGRGGGVISSRPIDRTALLVFYLGDRYFGVLTVFVPGKEAGDYGFTSSLPVAVLRLLAPDLEKLWRKPPTTPGGGRAAVLASNQAARKPATTIPPAGPNTILAIPAVKPPAVTSPQ